MEGQPETFAVEGIRRIELHVHQGNVRIARITGDMVEVGGQRGLSAELHDGILFIRPGHGLPREWRHSTPGSAEHYPPGVLGASISRIVTDALDSLSTIDIPPVSFGSGTVRVGIPTSLERPEVVVTTGSGNIELQGVTGDAALQSHSGDIVVTDSAGVLKATTGLGDLSLSSFAGPVTARTGSGDARLDRCGAGGTVHTGSGDISATQVSGTWKLDSGAGDILVNVLGKAGLEIVTGAGDVTVRGGELELLSVQTGSGDVACTSLLTGARHQIQSGNGDITVALADPPGARLQVLTRNGDVESDYPLVVVGKQGRHSHGGGRYVGNIGDSTIDLELRTASGDIAIRRRAPGEVDDSVTSRRFADPRRTEASDFAEAEAGPLEPLAPPAPTFRAPHSIQPTHVADGGVTVEPRDGQTAAPTSGNPRLAVLQNLQAGKITVGEAAHLLEALGQ